VQASPEQESEPLVRRRFNMKLMTSPRLELLSGTPDEMEALQQVIEAAPTYVERVTGLPPGPSDAQSTYMVLPEGKGYEDKFVFGIYLEGEMVGCVDLIRAYPDAETATLGLLLVAERYQRQGLGRAAFAELERLVRAWPSVKRVRLGVVMTNAAVLPFWERLGFRRMGEVKPYRYANVASEVVILEKPLRPTVL